MNSKIQIILAGKVFWKFALRSQVQITVEAKRYQLEKDPTALEKVTFSVVTSLEKDVASIQQLAAKSSSRRDFMLFPKKLSGSASKRSSSRDEDEDEEDYR